MSELNKKNINYGNLNRFYQNLKNHDLSGLATEEYVDNAIADIDYPEYTAGSNISINSNNEISCTYQYSLPTATTNSLGGVKVGDGLNINGSGILSTNVTNAMASYLKWIMDYAYNTFDSLPDNEKCLTIEATEDNTTVSYINVNNPTLCPIKYSFDLEHWVEVSPASGETINFPQISSGERIFIKGDNAKYGTSSSDSHYKFDSNKNCYYYGNIMSLINSTNYSSLTTISENFAFYNLFYNNTHLIMSNNKKMLLPATTLTEYCYGGMFDACTSLTITPELPATTLAKYCYSAMFGECTNLTTAPELPATTLVDSCYRMMFYGCTNLTTSPVLSATTLANNCYYGMFTNCTNLNTIICLATNISATNCTRGWVYNISATGTFYKNGTMSSWTSGIDGVPTGWTVQNYVASQNA